MQLNSLFKDPKKQRRVYSGKKKRHSLKTQLLVDKASQTIICTNSTLVAENGMIFASKPDLIIYESCKHDGLHNLFSQLNDGQDSLISTFCIKVCGRNSPNNFEENLKNLGELLDTSDIANAAINIW